MNNNLHNKSLITFGGYVVWILSGYMTGVFSKKAGIINGAITGLTTPFIITTYMVVGFGGWQNAQESVINYGLFWLFSGFFLCGIGGLAWDIQRKIT